MTTPPEPLADGPLERALDRALAQCLVPPVLPQEFRQQLRAAIALSAGTDHARSRAALEKEHAQQLAELQSGYVRLRQRTLGSLIGVAFAAGLLITFALPWITAYFGPNAVFALPAIGVAAGLALSLRSWWQRSGLARLLP
jgi:VIT1/CCC1 family predicted Fe2+/Mn2+ transporter